MSRLRQAAAALRHRALRLAVDRGAVVDPTSTRDLDEWGLDAPGRVDYAPAGGRLLARALREETVTSDHVFADLGAGLGRVVVQAARRPFARVIGVELVPDLLAGARANVDAQLHGAAHAKVELVGGDVTEWAVPPDLTHLFLNNPFRGAVLRTTLERVVDSLREHPRPLLLIYANPVDIDVVRDVGGFRTVRELPGKGPLRDSDRTIILRHEA